MTRKTVTIAGNIGADAEFATVNNQQVAKFTIFHTPKDGQGNDKESQPYHVTVFPDRDNKFPNYVANVVASVKKGDYWEVEGTEDISIFQDRNTGQPRIGYNLTARTLAPASIRTAVISVQKNQQGNQGGGQNFNQGNNGGGFNANQGQGQQGFGNQSQNNGGNQGGGFGQQQNQGGGFNANQGNNGGGFGNQGQNNQGGGFGNQGQNNGGNQGGGFGQQQNQGGGFGNQGQNNGGNQGGSENGPWGGGYDAPPF